MARYEENRGHLRKLDEAPVHYTELRADRDRQDVVLHAVSEVLGASKMESTVVIRRAEEGALGGSSGAFRTLFPGETVEETLENSRETIKGHVEALRREGRGVPPEEDLIIDRVRVSGAAV
ncbi:type II toxin-antitoxin system HicB family antitoxin [Methanoculleus sp. UBA291]|jgi:predicted RNase H-like HicB family nuclease|uniref:type II toxin-antitoxin system HicB family antitoxin n=2 Tax=Methanoculleus TaxID=45989 RepID=UPI00316ABD6F